MAIWSYKMEITVNQRLNMSICSFVPTVSNDPAAKLVHVPAKGTKAVNGPILVTGDNTPHFG